MILELSEESRLGFLPGNTELHYDWIACWKRRQIATRFLVEVGIASLDDRPCHCDAPWNFPVLIVGIWMRSAALSSTVGIETVEQESIQCI